MTLVDLNRDEMSLIINLLKFNIDDLRLRISQSTYSRCYIERMDKSYSICYLQIGKSDEMISTS